MNRPTRSDVLLLVALVPYLACTGASVWMTAGANGERARRLAESQQLQGAVDTARARSAAATRCQLADLSHSVSLGNEVSQLLADQRSLLATYRRSGPAARPTVLRQINANQAVIQTKLVAARDFQRVYRPDQATVNARRAELNRLVARQAGLAAGPVTPGWRRRLPALSPVTLVPYAGLWVGRVACRGREQFRRQRNRCPGCGYDLRGNVSGTCPECGRAGVPAAAGGG